MPTLPSTRSCSAATPLKYERDLNTVYVDFPETLRAGRTYEIAFHYSGTPQEQGRFGGLAFRKDPAGRHWINTANEGEGSSVWWPSKDQWRDEPEGMDIRVAVPNGLMDVSNGRFMGKTDLGDGYTRWDWRVHYPINSYNVSLNIGEYVQFSDRLGDLPLDYFVLPGSLEKAKKQFAQAGPMIEAFEKYVGKYPFPKDGYKLIEVPYSGMEHQSAVTYGNRFANGYLERDWTERRHQPEVRLHHHPRERPRVVRQRRVCGRRLGHVDPRGLDDVSRRRLRRSAVWLRRCAQVRERLQEEGRQQGADHHAARHPPRRRTRTCTSSARCS